MFERHSDSVDLGENPIRKNLEEQFRARQKLKIEGKDFKVVDIAPKDLKTNTPLVMTPGWAVSPETFKENILRLAESGRRVVSMDEYLGAPVEKADDYSHAQGRKAKALIKMLEQKGVEKVDVFAHSEGAIYVAMAALEHPEKFRNLVLVDPAGMIGKDSRVRLIMGSIREILSREINKYALTPIIEAVKSVLNNPRATVEEIFGIAQSQIGELLKILKSKGVGISIIHGVDDKIFPMEWVQKIVEKEMVDGFYSVKGTHDQIFLHPEEYTKLVDHALDALERKQAKNEPKS